MTAEEKGSFQSELMATILKGKQNWEILILCFLSLKKSNLNFQPE